MPNSKDDPNTKSNDPGWDFMSEYSLGKFMLDVDSRGKTRFRLLFHLVQDLGIPLECLKRIERTLTAFAKEALVCSNQGKNALAVYLHLLYQKKRPADVSSTETSKNFNAERSSEFAQIIQNSDLEMNAGWGYFLIERGGKFTAGSSTAPHHWIDLFLYKEGE